MKRKGAEGEEGGADTDVNTTAVAFRDGVRPGVLRDLLASIGQIFGTKPIPTPQSIRS